MQMSSSYDYFSTEKRLLKFLGISISDHDGNLFKKYSYGFIILLMCLYECVLLVDLFTRNFDEVLNSWSVFFGILLALAVIVATFFKRVKIGKLLKTFHQGRFVADAGVPSELVQKWFKAKKAQVLKYKDWRCFGSVFVLQTFVLVAAIFLCWGVQTGSVLVTRFTSASSNWKLSYGDLLMINTTYSPNFEIVCAYQNLLVICIAFTGITCIALLVGILEYIATQFKILQHRLAVFLTGSAAFDWRFLKAQMKEFVLYHDEVIGTVKVLEDIYGSAIFCTFAFTLGINCVQVYREFILPSNDVSTIGFFLETIVITGQSLLIRISGEHLANESERLGDAAYAIDFVGTDLRFQKLLITIIQITQEPVRVKAGKFTEVSMVTYAAILRATYSLFVMLQNINT